MSWKYWDEKNQSWRLVADEVIENYKASLGNIGVRISRREERTDKCNLGKLLIKLMELYFNFFQSAAKINRFNDWKS